MKYFIITIVFLFSFAEITAQRTCGTMGLLEQRIVENPKLRAIINSENEKTRLALSSMTADQRRTTAATEVYKIPVVVHLIGNNAITTISPNNYRKIHEQIQILNEDFRKKAGTNGDGTGVDISIEFFLATTDVNGNTTNGITQTTGHDNTNWNYSDDASLKSIIHWDEDKYLNIYVAKLKSLLGYATFPADLQSSRHLDGVVISELSFGKTNDQRYGYGRTLTHEVGHWLNLEHTWGWDYVNDIPGDCSKDDHVSDTPISSGGFYSSFASSCNTVNQCISQNSAIGSTSRRQIENYMDYSDDLCMNLFTQGQSDRMRMSIIMYRNNFTNPTLTGSSTICNTSTATYTLKDAHPTATVTWSVSSNLKIISSTNTNVRIKHKSCTNTGEASVSATINNGIKATVKNDDFT